MNADRDREFVEYVIKAIVNNPDAVNVTRTVDELGVLLSVKVSREDMGLLIGRSGSTAKAVRTLARIVGMRNNARVNLRIEEPEGGRMAPSGSVGGEGSTETHTPPPGGYGASPGKTKTLDDMMEGLDM